MTALMRREPQVPRLGRDDKNQLSVGRRGNRRSFDSLRSLRMTRASCQLGGKNNRRSFDSPSRCSGSLRMTTLKSMGGTYRTEAFPAADTGTCSTISMPKPSRPATLRGWLVSRRMRLRSNSDRICAPKPIYRCLGVEPCI